LTRRDRFGVLHVAAAISSEKEHANPSMFSSPRCLAPGLRRIRPMLWQALATGARMTGVSALTPHPHT
jgi:hypothetical protein